MSDQRHRASVLRSRPLRAGPAFNSLGVREVLAVAAAAQLAAMLVIGSSLLTHWGADATTGELTTGEA
jgi:hypothetical protein